jgi:hypothetical protein
MTQNWPIRSKSAAQLQSLQAELLGLSWLGRNPWRSFLARF